MSGTTFFDYPYPAYGLSGYDNGTVAYFRQMGYNITYQDPTSSSVSHAIGRLPDGNYLAAADPRKPAGYGAAL